MKLAASPPGTLPQHRESFTAVLMAGGQSRRMGRDKALLEIGGKPLWQRQIEVLRALAPAALWISGRAYGELSAIPDAWPDCGPLGGLASVLERAETKWVVVLAVDLPLMTAEFLRDLLHAAISEDAGIVPWDGQRFHPLAAAYPRKAAEVAREFLERRELAVQAFVHELHQREWVRRRWPSKKESAQLWNVNTPADLEALGL